MRLLAAVRSLGKEKMVCEFELILQNIFGFSERPPPPCSKLNFVKIAVVMSRDAGPKKPILFIARTREPLGPGGRGGSIVPPYCGRNRRKTISFKRSWVTTCVLPPLDFQTFHRPWKKLVKKGVRPPRLRSGSEISSSRDIRRQILWLIFFSHTH
jgi:hypothetical protein